TGTPTAPGAASFTVQVRDNAAATATKSFNLTINPASLVVATSTLPIGTSGAADNQNLAASGGMPPYAWSLTSGTLPQGLTLSQSGTISGIPTGTGTSFTVQVPDRIPDTRYQIVDSKGSTVSYAQTGVDINSS